MDLITIEAGLKQASEVYDLPLVNELGEPDFASDKTRCTIGIVGVDSQTYRDNVEAYFKSVARLPREEQDKVDTDVGTAFCGVVRWHGFENAGQPLPCTRENGEKFLRARYLLVQVQGGIQRHASFFVKPSTG